MALVGAASSYFAYQKKKLCFKIQGGQCVTLCIVLSLVSVSSALHKRVTGSVWPSVFFFSDSSGQDPESGKVQQGIHSDPQGTFLSSLLQLCLIKTKPAAQSGTRGPQNLNQPEPDHLLTLCWLLDSCWNWNWLQLKTTRSEAKPSRILAKSYRWTKICNRLKVNLKVNVV